MTLDATGKNSELLLLCCLIFNLYSSYTPMYFLSYLVAVAAWSILNSKEISFDTEINLLKFYLHTPYFSF